MSSVYHSRLAGVLLAGLRACLIVTVIALLLTVSPTAYAQSIYANLSGTVTDATGAVVSDARVTVENAGTKVTRHRRSWPLR